MIVPSGRDYRSQNKPIRSRVAIVELNKGGEYDWTLVLPPWCLWYMNRMQRFIPPRRLIHPLPVLFAELLPELRS